MFDDDEEDDKAFLNSTKINEKTADLNSKLSLIMKKESPEEKPNNILKSTQTVITNNKSSEIGNKNELTNTQIPTLNQFSTNNSQNTNLNISKSTIKRSIFLEDDEEESSFVKPVKKEDKQITFKNNSTNDPLMFLKNDYNKDAATISNKVKKIDENQTDNINKFSGQEAIKEVSLTKDISISPANGVDTDPLKLVKSSLEEQSSTRKSEEKYHKENYNILEEIFVHEKAHSTVSKEEIKEEKMIALITSTFTQIIEEKEEDILEGKSDPHLNFVNNTEKNQIIESNQVSSITNNNKMNSRFSSIQNVSYYNYTIYSLFDLDAWRKIKFPSVDETTSVRRIPRHK